MIDMTLPLYKKYYMFDEIKAIIVFYRTPLGKKIIGVSPEISQEVFFISQQWAKGYMEKIIERQESKGLKRHFM